MTREEHIYQLEQYLKGHSICMCPSSSLYWQEHWEEVIKALEQEPTTKNDLGVDCISRKAILDELEKWDWQELYLPIHFKQMLDELPSVTPQESFINKPCVSSGVCEYDKQKVLDKIRAEIKALTSNRGFLSCSVDSIHEEIDAVFDKYKTESEEP